MPLIPMALLLAYYQSRQRDTILETHYNLAEVLSSDITHYVEDLNWRLSFIPDLQEKLKQGKDASSLLKKAFQEHSDMNVLAIIDQNGKSEFRLEKDVFLPEGNRLTADILAEMSKLPRIYIAPLETLQGTLEFEFILPISN